MLLNCGLKFPLSKIQVHWVLGVPIGQRRVPVVCDNEEKDDAVARLCDVYVTQCPSGSRGVERKTIMEVVEAHVVDELKFKETFLMMAVNNLLATTSCHRMSVKMLPFVAVACKAKEYDWCSFVLEHLLKCVGNFAKRFYGGGFAKCCGDAQSSRRLSNIFNFLYK